MANIAKSKTVKKLYDGKPNLKWHLKEKKSPLVSLDTCSQLFRNSRNLANYVRCRLSASDLMTATDIDEYKGNVARKLSLSD